MRISIFLLVILSLSPTANALVLGGSNLGFEGYPDHSCLKPTKPFKPYRFDSEYEIDFYKASIASYNAELAVYIDCIKTYLKNATNDIERIKEKYNEAVESAKELD